VQGPDGKWWVLYTIVLANSPDGRRSGMDAVDFDANGNMFTHGPSNAPQWALCPVDHYRLAAPRQL